MYKLTNFIVGVVLAYFVVKYLSISEFLISFGQCLTINQISYIHPDEHFQSLEILTQLFYGTKGTIPWEYNPENAARSYVPQLIFYGPIYYLFADVWQSQDAQALLLFVRMQNFTISFFTSLLLKSYIIPTPVNKRPKVTLYLITSYVAWTFQKHSFSNSIETIILLTTIATFTFQLKSAEKSHYMITIVQGLLITLGIFNRMTFPAFILLPSIKLFCKYYLKHLKCFICLLITIGASTLACVYVDTQIYGTNEPVIAPWNNLLYNMSVSNLSKHGLHPRYTHILINIPQLVGPAIVYLIPYIKKDFKGWFTKLPNLSICSALLLLSIFPHQELRFLIPIVPFICMQLPNIKSRWFFKLWIAFNTVMFIIMGVYHQSGVIDTIISQRYFDEENINVHLWWKTYSPPTWMYMNNNLTVSTTNFVDNVERIDSIDFNININHVIDLKGCDTQLTNDTITGFFDEDPKTVITLFYPTSVQSKVSEVLNRTDIQFKSKYYTRAHLDLDHFDMDDLSTFMPGFNAIEISHI